MNLFVTGFEKFEQVVDYARQILWNTLVFPVFYRQCANFHDLSDLFLGLTESGSSLPKPEPPRIFLLEHLKIPPPYKYTHLYIFRLLFAFLVY